VCGHLGCTRSHIRALEYAKERGWRRYIVLEDDFVFKVPKERVLHILAEFLATHKDDWGVFVLGLFPKYHVTHDTDVPFIKRLVSATTASGYMVNAKYHDVLYANVVEGEALCAKEVDAFAASNPGARKTTTQFPIDQYWRALQRRDGWYTSDGCIGHQSTSWSSIARIAPLEVSV
jgi:GR25 family glycosyltransferase involved in LPS biosynthesis